ncbi:Heat shock protein DnaJ [Macrophomina phaseolina MS6]|uniref:Heat shock protein DnaJ n=1 Tax=Macrophomina phaseolina (strain MS6) TaxID=1126212 RepID=K2RJZ6_MACPH|nr:Heat shock protein DnaJ [Macrophomina phaseolina MS6]
MPRKQQNQAEDIEDLISGEPPTSIDPYRVLGVANDATSDVIKTAYRKAALKHHPDKADDKEVAHTKFQEIAFAYAILSDPRRRSRYDTTGRIEETVDLEDDEFNWTEFYKEQFEGIVTTEAIEKFKQEYKGGAEERSDLLEAYKKFKGSMSKIYQVIMLSDPLEDEERFRSILDTAIADGTVPAEKNYTEESEKSRQNRMKAVRKEADEAKDALNEIKGSAKRKKRSQADGDLGDLAALIQKRQKGRAESFFDQLEAKYAPDSKKGKKRAPPPEEPSEEAFQRTASRAKKGKK